MNNLITPDELVVSFKRNGYEKHVVTSTQNLHYSVFGCLPQEWSNFQNIIEVAKKFKMVEFLSGSMILYIFNNVKILGVYDESLRFTVPCTFFVAYKTARRWLPETSTNPQQEELFPTTTTKNTLWTQISEHPGVSGKFISNGGGAKPIQKLKWKFTQKSWDTLKADRTGFQCSLAEDGTLLPSGQPYYPLNNAIVKVAFDTADTSATVGAVDIYSSQRILLRFKGRRE